MSIFESMWEDKFFLYRIGIVLICIITTFILLQNVTGTHNTQILQSLSNFPKQLGPWTLQNTRESGSEVINLLGVNDYIDYTYQNNKGNQINFYVGFYESVGTGGGYHSPKNCLPGGGWGIDTTKNIKITPNKKLKTQVNATEMIIRNGNQYQVVFYWYQNRGRIIASEYWEKIYLVLDALIMKRRDGSFVRLMAQAPQGNIKKAETLLKNFAQLAMPQLDNYLPGKNSIRK
ncbi:MAG: EpsI family protein [Deltaproteobacteria bacterium]|jgi:EpsI family protein|nr:EpsI family protein [Deltaproteobacteria bacterium]